MIEVDLLVLAGPHAFDIPDPVYCCLEARFHVSEHGWADFTGGETLLESVHRATGDLSVRGVHHDEAFGDWFVRRRLRGIAPGHGVKGWQSQVFADVDRHHRHHDSPQGWKFGVEVRNGDTRVGVAVVGRPVSRVLAKARPHTLEVTRVCTWGPDALRRNAASKLYALCAKRAGELGATELITYTLAEEGGASLRAAGFVVEEARTKGGTWGRKGRPRKAQNTGPKTRWVLRIRPRDGLAVEAPQSPRRSRRLRPPLPGQLVLPFGT